MVISIEKVADFSEVAQHKPINPAELPMMHVEPRETWFILSINLMG